MRLFGYLYEVMGGFYFIFAFFMAALVLYPMDIIIKGVVKYGKNKANNRRK